MLPAFRQFKISNSDFNVVQMRNHSELWQDIVAGSGRGSIGGTGVGVGDGGVGAGGAG
jgi:hypothetical protein